MKIAFPILLFLLHASAYLYFFVDDEGITAVYARNVLEGRGLVYAPSAGPAEGYSNFLHVFVIAAILALVDAAGLDRWWVFVAGGIVSLVCGALLVTLLWNLSGRLGVSNVPRVTCVVLLALSGPLAVWSNSALETVPFALAFMALIASTLPDVGRPALTAAAAIAVMLMRADGALFAFLWLAARWIAGDRRARRIIGRGVLPVCGVAGLTYMAWRVWYFGSWLPLPLETKVAHKLASVEGADIQTVRATYVRAWAIQAGWPLLLGLIPAAVALARRSTRDRGLLTVCGVLAVLFAYVALVGDWMFGFRFVVPLLAPLALVGALGLSQFATTRPAIVRVAAALAIGCAAIVAGRFLDVYQRDQQKAVFWASPSLDPAERFGEYYEALQAVRPFVSAGDRIAYHEAGFVPFMLDVENVDMLGLTSPFVGRAPTLDAIFTDVGRYYPLTHEPAHHAVHAYLVHQQPSLIVVRSRWMRTANRGRIPPQILRGYFDLVHETPMFALYRRSRPSSPHRIAAAGFLENLAHPAYAARIAVNDARLTPRSAVETVPSLAISSGHELLADPEWSLYVDPRESAPVHELYIEGHAPEVDVRVEVRLSAAGRPPLRFEHVALAGQPLLFNQRLSERHPIDTIEIRFTSLGPASARFHLRAIRVMGQTTALRRHLARHGIP